eukprot:UN22995
MVLVSASVTPIANRSSWIVLVIVDVGEMSVSLKLSDKVSLNFSQLVFKKLYRIIVSLGTTTNISNYTSLWKDKVSSSMTFQLRTLSDIFEPTIVISIQLLPLPLSNVGLEYGSFLVL